MGAFESDLQNATTTYNQSVGQATVQAVREGYQPNNGSKLKNKAGN